MQLESNGARIETYIDAFASVVKSNCIISGSHLHSLVMKQHMSGEKSPHVAHEKLTHPRLFAISVKKCPSELSPFNQLRPKSLEVLDTTKYNNDPLKQSDPGQVILVINDTPAAPLANAHVLD